MIIPWEDDLVRVKYLLDCFVPGKPVAQGSMRAMPLANSRKIVMLHANKELQAWRLCIQSYVQYLATKYTYIPMTRGKVSVTLGFLFNNHPRQKKALPDLDKLIRAVLDAMSKIVFVDDKDVVSIWAYKILGNEHPEGVYIRVIEMSEKTLTGIGDRLSQADPDEEGEEQ